MQVDTKVFRHLVSSEFPAASRHLEEAGADVSQCVFVQWFLCLFVNLLPLEACLRVWDLLMFRKSTSVLFQVVYRV